MPYKSPEEAKLATRERVRRYRALQKGVTKDDVTPDVDVTPHAQGVTGVNVTPSQNVTPDVTPDDTTRCTPIVPYYTIEGGVGGVDITKETWADRRNYPVAYLAALDAQGGKLTEASAVAMVGHQVDEATRLAFVRRHGMITGKAFQGVHSEPVEMERVAGVTDYPPLLYALADPIKREKLRRVCRELKSHEVSGLDGKRHTLLSELRYGLSGPAFDTVDECLEVLA